MVYLKVKSVLYLGSDIWKMIHFGIKTNFFYDSKEADTPWRIINCFGFKSVANITLLNLL